MSDFPNEQGNSPVQDPGRGLAIASMVLGIVSVALFCAWYLAIPCAIVGLVLGIVAKRKGSPSKMAMAGIVLSIIALGIAILMITVLAGAISSIGGLGALADYAS